MLVISKFFKLFNIKKQGGLTCLLLVLKFFLGLTLFFRSDIVFLLDSLNPLECSIALVFGFDILEGSDSIARPKDGGLSENLFSKVSANLSYFARLMREFSAVFLGSENGAALFFFLNFNL